jgi:hypothetical protein
MLNSEGSGSGGCPYGVLCLGASLLTLYFRDDVADGFHSWRQRPGKSWGFVFPKIGACAGFLAHETNASYCLRISNFEQARIEIKEVAIVKQSDSDGAGQGKPMN